MTPSPPKPTAASTAPTKPAEEDKIEPNKSAYTPVSLPPPKKLKNPFAQFEQQAAAATPPPRPAAGTGPKKLTWSERQALAKKQQEEEEARSRAAGFNVQKAASPVPKPTFKSSAPAFGRATTPATPPRNFGAVGAAVGAGAAIGAGAAVAASTYSREEPEEEPALEPEPEPEVAVCTFNFVHYIKY